MLSEVVADLDEARVRINQIFAKKPTRVTQEDKELLISQVPLLELQHQLLVFKISADESRNQKTKRSAKRSNLRKTLAKIESICPNSTSKQLAQTDEEIEQAGLDDAGSTVNGNGQSFEAVSHTALSRAGEQLNRQFSTERSTGKQLVSR